MALAWFRCPICGAQWQGDSRYQPMCPNTANHPRVQPGPVVQPVFVVVPRRRRRFKLPPFTASKKRSLQTAGLLYGGFLVFALVASVILIIGSFILSHVLPHAPGVTQAGLQPITTATLGGTYDAFQAKYGASQVASPGPSRSWKVTIDGIHALITETLDAPASSDGLYHIDTLTIAPDGGAWTQATADKVLPTFLPEDAVQQPDETIPGVGPAHLYVSAELAATFPANWFIDHQGRPVKPGTFSAAFNTSKGMYTLRLGTSGG